MADFKLTRQQAMTSVPGALTSMIYHTALAAWDHPSGATLSAEQIPFNPVYCLLWRSEPAWGCRGVEYCTAFEERDPEKAWKRLLVAAEEAYKAGPGSPLLDTREQMRARNKESGRRGGLKKAENAAAKAEADLLKGDGLPRVSTKKWEYFRKDNCPYPYHVLQDPKNKGVCIIWENPDVLHGWDVRLTWPPKLAIDTALLNDQVDVNSQDEAVALVERIAAIPPERWVKGLLRSTYDAMAVE